jgi:transposase
MVREPQPPEGFNRATKTDKIDAAKIAGLLRGGLFPQAYVYPTALRATRDLLRRRTFLVRQRAQFLAHVQNTNSQYNLPPFPKKLSFAGNRDADAIVGRFPHESTRRAIAADLAMVEHLDEQIRDLELYLTRTAKVDDPVVYHLLRTVPGIGPVLGLILLYEVHDIGRFPEAGHFLSYARLVRCAHESAGKKKGFGGRKIGNAHLKWAFSEAACLMLRGHAPAKK